MNAPNTSKQPEITVFRGWEEFGKHVWSPYVVKLETRLRFAGLRYKTEAGSLKAAPRGKIPYINIYDPSSPTSPVSLGDSTLIIKNLTERGDIPDLNDRLNPVQRVHDMALRALLEDKLSFYHTYERWVQNYYVMRDHALWSIPYPIRMFIGVLVHRKITTALQGQGTGKFTAEEIAAFRLEIWEGLNSQLMDIRSASGGGNEPFWVLGGSEPTEADASLFAFVVSVLISTASPDSQKVVRNFPVLLDYASRIHDRYFPDYEKWVI